MKAEYCLSELDAGMCGELGAIRCIQHATPSLVVSQQLESRNGKFAFSLPHQLFPSVASLCYFDAPLLHPFPFPLIPPTFHTSCLLMATPPMPHSLQTCLRTCIPLSPAGFLSFPFKVLWRKPIQAKHECKALRLSIQKARPDHRWYSSFPGLVCRSQVTGTSGINRVAFITANHSKGWDEVSA